MEPVDPHHGLVRRHIDGNQVYPELPLKVSVIEICCWVECHVVKSPGY